MKKCASVLAAMLMSGPVSAWTYYSDKGAVDVEETTTGFKVIDLAGGGTTLVEKIGRDYMVIYPDRPATYFERTDNLLDPPNIGITVNPNNPITLELNR